MSTNSDLILLLEKRIKVLEENCAWMEKDMSHLVDIVESLKPEIHYHTTYHIMTKPQENPLSDFDV